jgi:hypothetical protein
MLKFAGPRLLRWRRPEAELLRLLLSEPMAESAHAKRILDYPGFPQIVDGSHPEINGRRHLGYEQNVRVGIIEVRWHMADDVVDSDASDPQLQRLLRRRSRRRWVD